MNNVMARQPISPVIGDRSASLINSVANLVWGVAAAHRRRVRSRARSISSDVRQLPRRRLDPRARFQQHRGGVPSPRHELVARAVGHGGLDHAVAEAYLLLFHVYLHRSLGLAAYGFLQPLEVFLGGAEA